MESENQENKDDEELKELFGQYYEIMRNGMVASACLSSVGRNDLCPCESGKKYKKCCLSAHNHAVSVYLKCKQIIQNGN